MKVEVDVLGSRPNKPTVSVDVKQHSTKQKDLGGSILLRLSSVSLQLRLWFAYN